MDPLPLLTRHVAASISIPSPRLPTHFGPGTATATICSPRRFVAGSDQKNTSFSRVACGNVSQLEAVPTPSNDDGCWWLMSGFSAPNSGLPPQISSSGPSSPLPPPGSQKFRKPRSQELNHGSVTSEPHGSASGTRSGNGAADNGTALVEAPDHTSVGEAREGAEGRNGLDTEGAERRGGKKRTPVRKPISENNVLGGTGLRVAYQALELWIADRAVLPIENSLGGSIHRNFDLMLHHRLHIVGEVQMVINHCLMALPGTSLEELKQVHSHPQALAQCEMRLRELGVTTQNSVDTAGAAQTSIVFTLDFGPGNLSQALQVFASRKINFTKIESRPLKKVQGEQLAASPVETNPFMEEASRKGIHVFDYLFYVDLEASMAEPRAQNALRHLQEFARYLRVLGSYPMDVSPVAKL